jgi:hypothetical protein
LATKSHQVLLLPLLATTHAWQQRLSLQPHAAPLAAMLGSLLGKLQGHWGGFCAGQVAAVEQYDSRSKMGLQQGKCNTTKITLQVQLTGAACDAVQTIGRGACVSGRCSLCAGLFY